MMRPGWVVRPGLRPAKTAITPQINVPGRTNTKAKSSSIDSGGGGGGRGDLGGNV